MEGYMIRVPTEACFPDTCSAWEQKSDAHRPVCSRVLYYVLEEGYLRGYKTPNDVNEPVESFRLTSNRVEVNTMCSLNIFEVKARVGKLRLPQHFVDGTSSSDTSKDEDDDDIDAAALYMPQTTISSSPNMINKNYHVVFFAANTDLVKKWSVKLLNWTRSVFGSSAGHGEAELRMAKTEILHALHVMNAANQFLRPIEIPTTPQADTETAGSPAITSEQVSTTAASINLPVLVNGSSKRTTNATLVTDLADVVKPSDMSTHTQPPNPWWIASFGRHRKISSYSQRC